jgi:hypothetical protein
MQKNIGNFTALLKLHNIGTHLKGIETSFQVVTLFSKSFNIWVSYITFWHVLKIPALDFQFWLKSDRGAGLSKAEWCVDYTWFMLLKDTLVSFEKSMGISPILGFQFWLKSESLGFNGTQLLWA